MFWTSLNKKLDYTLKGKTYRPTQAEIRLIYLPSIKRSDWSNNNYKNYKDSLKNLHYFGQTKRCAYCRLNLRVDAYWDELDHIVAQTTKGEWIFYPKNLVVSCKPCNSLKNATDTRANPANPRFPLHSNGFTVFNPHFDKWSDHFEIVKGIFLRGKTGTKGPNTYEEYHLYRYHITLGYAEELRYKNQKTYRRLTHLLRDTSLTAKQVKSLQDGIKHLVESRKHGRQ